MGGLGIHEEQNGHGTEEGDVRLRCALRHLQPFLGQIGLSPIHIIPFMRGDERFRGFPDREVQRNLIDLEARDDVQLAAASFIDALLDTRAPQGTLSNFLHSLKQANDHEDNPNEGAWHVHDVLTLACVYMPVQDVLVNLLSDEDHLQSLDLQTVVSALSDRRLLTASDLTHVMETLMEPEGAGPASVRMLAFLYKEQARRARENYLSEIEGRNDESATPEGDVSTRPLWLEALLDVMERYGGQRIRQMISAELVSSDTWGNALDRLAFRQCIRSHQAAEDDAGSVADSDATVREDQGEGHHPGDQGQRRLEGPVLQQSNLTEIRRQRTIEFVSESKHAPQQIPHIIEFILYDRRLKSGTEETPQPADLDDACSTVTSNDTVSTEDNTKTRDLLVEAENREFARTLRYSGVSEGDEKGGPPQIRLRPYQEEQLMIAREGRNVVIILPTGTGKTFIVIKYVQDYLSKSGLGRVVFLAPKVKLAEQQYRRFVHFFPKDTYFRCGRSRSSNAPFKELLDSYRVYVMTPQCLVEAIGAGEVQITDFSLMVLDECHHTLGKHPYKDLMDLYMDAKFSADIMPHLPQIIGLTASPRVGPGGTLESATSLLRELCANMDVEKLCTVVKNERELERYVNEPTHEIRMCRKRLKDGFRKIIEGMMKTIEDNMLLCASTAPGWSLERREQLKKLLMAPNSRGSLRYTQWVTTLTTHLVHFGDNKQAHMQLFSFAEMLLRYQRSLILNEDCESRYALDYLEEQVHNMEEMGRLTQIERQMLADFQRLTPMLQRACNDPEDYNPKLSMLEDVLRGIMERHQDEASCMVFVRTLELTRAVQQWMKDQPDLKELEPGRITGSRKSVIYGGMTKVESEDVMKGFNEGKHKVVICTSAAEEGLDFQACNIVVRYDYVTSMVAMIQTRGRARRMDSRYLVLGDQAQGSVDKEKENLASERLMRQAVAQIQRNMDENPNDFRSDMNKKQNLEWTTRRKLEEEAKRAERFGSLQDSARYDLLCRKCQQRACTSSDIRLYANSSRIIVSDDFRHKWKRVQREYNNETYQNMEKVAKVHCNHKDDNGDDCSFDWGCLVKYIPSEKEYPVIKLESFVLVDRATGKKVLGKLKWGKAPFIVTPLTEEEIARL